MLALTHAPSANIDHGERTHVARLSVDYAVAVRQHADYCAMLGDCGANVRTLNVNHDHPDGTFIEDTAVVLDETAVLASMGAPSRRAEPAGIERELQKYCDVQRILPPATLEGGDVLRVGRTLLVGLSSRTNPAGVEAFETIVRHYGYRVVVVPVHGCLHLKTACTALPDNSLLVNPSWVEVRSLAEFEFVPVPVQEPWAANTLTIGSSVCISDAHARTAEIIRQHGFAVRTVCLSEFAKVEGCVTCLSLLVDR